MTPTLYERTEALRLVDSWFADAEGEVTPELEALAAEATLAFREKLDACAEKRAEFLAHAQALTDESMRLAARAAALQKRAEWLADYMGRMMVLANVTKHEGDKFTVARVMNPPKVVAITADELVTRDDVDALPEPLRACVTIKPPQPEQYAWDKRAILALAKQAPDLAAQVARIERDERITIK